MADNWFLLRDGTRYGPFTGIYLRKHAATGHLLPLDLVIGDGMTEPVSAAKVEELFPIHSTPEMPIRSAPTDESGAATERAAPTTRRPTTQPSRMRLLYVLGGCGVLVVIAAITFVAVSSGRKATASKSAEAENTIGVSDHAPDGKLVGEPVAAEVALPRGAPESEPRSAMPNGAEKNWELRFNTGRNRPAYDAKSGVLKLVYDFSDARQLKDFEYDEGVKSSLHKGVLTLKGGGELKHVVCFNTLSVSGVIVCGQFGKPMQTTEGHELHIRGVGFSGFNHPMGVAVFAHGKEVTAKNLGMGNIEDAVAIPLKNWHVGPKTTGVEIGQIDLSGKLKEGKAGHLRLVADKAANQYSRITISGTLDPEWAKVFFADE